MSRLIIIFVTFILTFVYRQIIRLILKTIHRSQFAGLLEGPDVVWSTEDISDSFINALIIVSSHKNPDDFIETAKTVITEKCFKNNSKFTYIRRKMFGYSYFLKNTVFDHDYTKLVKVHGVMDKKYLEQLIMYCCNNEISDSALCEVTIFNQPEDRGTKNQFYILFRIDHSLCDGFSLIDFFVHNFSGRQVPENHYTKLWHNSHPINLNVFSFFWNVFYGTGSVMLQTVLKPIDRSSLHGPPLSGKKTVAWTIEEKEKLFPVIKMIKNKLNTRFSDIILAAISESFKDFYAKKGEVVPKFLTCVIPKPVKSDSQSGLHNSFSVAMLQLPVDNDISSTLDATKIQTQTLRRSPDYMVHHWLLTLVCTVFPEPLLKPLIYSSHSTMVISIMPGTRKLTVFQEDILEDVVFWVPLRGSTGVGVSVLTYDNRLQIGITVDKALMSEQEDLQGVVDGIFTNIQKLYETVYTNV